MVLANIYVDLGTWWHLTPFVGVGVGGAYNRISNFQDIGVETASANNFYDDGYKWNFAWALHAGIGLQGHACADARTGLPLHRPGRRPERRCAVRGTALGATGYQQFNHITSHDLKFGVRWMLEPPFPPPLMRRG